MTVLALTVLGYTRLPVDGHYWPDLLPLYLIFALGLAFGFIPVTIAAFIGVAAPPGGARVGTAEHEPADRRRDRRRGHVDDLRLEGEVRSLHAAGVHLGLPLGVRSARRVRRRRRSCWRSSSSAAPTCPKPRPKPQRSRSRPRAGRPRSAGAPPRAALPRARAAAAARRARSASGRRSRIRAQNAIVGRTARDEERDVEQLGEDGERAVERAVDLHREAARAVGRLDLPLDQLRRAGVDVGRGEDDAADRREPGRADALRARLERRPQRAVAVPARRCRAERAR